MQFNDLNIIPEIQKALLEESYSNPTPIQAEAIPFIIDKNDLLGCAQTGTGKTAAFAIPILQLLMHNKSYERQRPIKCLILTPTRELAIQIDESFKAYGRHLPLTSVVIFGGVRQTPQTELLKRGVDILIATPGRLLDLINQGFIHLKHIDIFVLDEADRMLDMGFIHDVKKIISMLPAKRQNLFFSATMPPEVVKLANTILRKPKEVSVTPVSSTAEMIEQFIYFVDKENKNSLLIEVLKNQAMKSVLVFARAKHGADKIAKNLNKHNIKAEAIHGDKGQNTRQKALQNFKSGITRVLVATDIVSRGIDIDDLQYVVNFDLPNIAETYVHRIGRTGRAGANGTAISFCHADEKPYLKDIEKLIAKKITVVEEHPFPLMNHNPVKPPAPQSRKKQTAHERPKEQVQTPAQKHNFRSKKSKQR